MSFYVPRDHALQLRWKCCRHVVTCWHDMICGSNFGQMGPCRRHNFFYVVAVCVGLSRHLPDFPKCVCRNMLWYGSTYAQILSHPHAPNAHFMVLLLPPTTHNTTTTHNNQNEWPPSTLWRLLCLCLHGQGRFAPDIIVPLFPYKCAQVASCWACACRCRCLCLGCQNGTHRK